MGRGLSLISPDSVARALALVDPRGPFACAARRSHGFVGDRPNLAMLAAAIAAAQSPFTPDVIHKVIPWLRAKPNQRHDAVAAHQASFLTMC